LDEQSIHRLDIEINAMREDFLSIGPANRDDTVPPDPKSSQVDHGLVLKPMVTTGDPSF
jgi:hypothetical protein